MRAASSGLLVPAMGLAGEGAGEVNGMLQLVVDFSGTDEALWVVTSALVEGGVSGAGDTMTHGMGDITAQQMER